MFLIDTRRILTSLLLVTSLFMFDQKIDYPTGLKRLPVIDVRSLAGVDCTGATDSSTALNNLWDSRLGGNINGRTVAFPNCSIRADSPLVMFGQSFVVLDGLGREPTQNNGSAIFGCNGMSGAVLQIVRSGHIEIRGLALDAKGVSCSSSFTGSVLVNNEASGGVTATDILFTNVSVNTNRGGTQITNYIGIQVAASVSGQNTERIKVQDSTIVCGSQSPGSKGLAFLSGNSDHTEIIHNEIKQCLFGIHGRMGGTIQDNNLSNGSFSDFGAGGANIHATACAAQQLFIVGNELAEGSGQLFQNEVGGGCPNVTIMNTAQNTDAIDPSVFDIDVGNGITNLVLIGNNINLQSVTSMPVVGTSTSSTTMSNTKITHRGNTVSGDTGGLLQNVRITQGTCCGDIFKTVKPAQVAAITTTAFASPQVNSTFRLSAQVNCTTSSAAATAIVTLAWTDTSNTAQMAVLSTATCTTLGASSLAELTKVVRAKGGTDITYAVAIANTPTYDVTVSAETLSTN